MSRRTAHILEQKWRSDDIRIGEDADFSSLLLPKELLKGLKAAGFKNPSPIQLKAIPVGKIGKDLIVQAKSGTGKTLVFSVIALNMLLKGATHPQVLIMAPTREIACQICQVIKCIAVAYKDFHCEYFIGGRRLEEDMPRIQGCQVVVGTPGRIKQMINCKILKTAGIRLFVLDEADQLLKETSFTTDIDDIFRALPRDKQMIATSATYPDKLKKLTNKYFRDPLPILLNKNDCGLLGMVHYYHVIPVSKLPVVAYKKKLKCLEDVLLNVKFAQCLVFCNMVSRVENLCVEIKNWGFATSFISSAREQEDRLKAIELLKKFKCKVLVSSDVSARGIDAENVDLVINFDLPAFLDTYFHRVGRAGRYASKCASITFITSDEIDAHQEMQQKGNFKSFPLPDHLPSDLISMQPKMKHIVNNEILSLDDETEPSSDSSLDSDNLEQEKSNGFSKDLKLNGHKGLRTSKVDELISKNSVIPLNTNLVDSNENIDASVSQGVKNQSDDSSSTTSAKEEDNLSSTSESVEVESITNSSGSVEGEKSTSVNPSNEIAKVEKVIELNANESINEESFENSQLVRKVLAEKNSEAFEENGKENYQCDKYPDNIHELQPIMDTSSCLADIESIYEKTVYDKSLVVNKASDVSKMLNHPDSKELVSSVITFMKKFEDHNEESEECFTAVSAKSSEFLEFEPSEKFSAESLVRFRSNLTKYQYNVCANFMKDISEDMNQEKAHEYEKESAHQPSEIGNQHCSKQNDGENKIKASGLDSRNVLFSTPKTDVITGSKSGHSSGQETSSESDKCKLIEHFNSMVGTIDKIKTSSSKIFTSDSSSISELNSDTSINSRNAMYRLTKEFNKLTQKEAGGYKKETNKNMEKSNIINNTELSSSSTDFDSGTSVDSENADNELEKEFTKLIKVQKSDKSSNKNSSKTKKILQKIKDSHGFEGIEIVDIKKHAMSSTSSTSDSDYNNTKKHVESSIDSSSDSNISTEINKRKVVAATTKSSKSSRNTTKTRSLVAPDDDKYSKESSSGSKKNNKKGKVLQANIMKRPVRNKVAYDYSGTSSSETESYIEQYSKESISSSTKIHKKGKALQVKTMKGPVQNKITYYYSEESYSETASDIDQYIMESQSGLHDRHQRKLKTLKKCVDSKTEPSQFNYSNTNGTLGSGERQTLSSAHSYFQRQPTNYTAANSYNTIPPTNHSAAANTNYQMQPTNYAAANLHYQPFPQQIQNHGNPGLLLGAQCSHQMNPYHQSYPQVQNNTNYGLFPFTVTGHQAQPTNFTCNPYYQPYPCECPLKEYCQMSKMQSSGSGHSAGNVQSQNFAYNQCCVPSQHPCHPPNESCQSPACAAWYDLFYKQWRFLNKPSYF